MAFIGVLLKHHLQEPSLERRGQAINCKFSACCGYAVSWRGGEKRADNLASWSFNFPLPHIRADTKRDGLDPE